MATKATNNDASEADSGADLNKMTDQDHLPRERSNTISQPITIPELASSKHRVELVKCEDIVIHSQSPEQFSTSSARDCQLCEPPAHNHNRRIGSAPEGEKIPGRRRHRCRHFSTGMEDSPSPMINPMPYPRSSPPRKGQSIFSYLENFYSGDSELQRENAHFQVCQAVICALEQLKWAMQLERFHQAEEGANDDSEGVAEEADRDRDQCPTAGDISFELDSEVISVSMATSCVAEWDRERDSNAAEVCGLILLSKFKNLPPATDVHWMGSCDEGCSSHCDAWARGAVCRDWAPPRPQIIFTSRVNSSSRKKTLREQNYRCRGCGCYVSAECSATFRLCSYTGHYFCTVCHRNQMSVIPSRVLEDWDFKLFPVSSVAYRTLDDIWYSPLFHIATINPMLFRRVPVLNVARKLRGSLKLARDHIQACRFYQQEGERVLQKMPEYFVTDELWSLADLKAVKRGSYKETVEGFIRSCEDHVQGCELCLARGFICEVCRGEDILFPWNPRVIRCSCGSCSHVACWTEMKDCPKCRRVRHRK